jgi:hypothetical protein
MDKLNGSQTKGKRIMITLLAIFLILHGLVHIGLAAAPNPAVQPPKPGAFFTAPERTWLLSRMGLDPVAIRWTGIGLVALSTLGFIVLGLGLLGVSGFAALWPVSGAASALVSLALLGIFWHPWLVVGVAINIGVLALACFGPS